MTVLVRKFYTNTGLKGRKINPNKPKLSVAFTAERNEHQEQVVQFGVSSCSPVDQFVRKVGGAIAESRLKLVVDGSEIPADIAQYVGSVIFPPETNLDEIPELIVSTFEHLNSLVRKAAWKDRNAAEKELSELYDKRSAIFDAFYKNPELVETEERISKALDKLYPISSNY